MDEYASTNDIFSNSKFCENKYVHCSVIVMSVIITDSLEWF